MKSFFSNSVLLRSQAHPEHRSPGWSWILLAWY